MKKFLITAIFLFFTPVWLALLFVFGQNSAGYLSSKNLNPDLIGINLPKLYLVQSGSMEPAVDVGSVVIVSSDSTYVNGDIISFDVQGNGKNIITHRIAYKEFPDGIEGDPEYVTKGDANEDFDATKIKNNNIIGKVRVTLPYLGYLASYAKKPWGFILLVIVPATILIYEELKTIFWETKRGAKKVFGKLRKSNTNSISLDYPKSDAEPKQNFFTKLFKSFAYMIPIFGAGLVFVSLSASYFADNEPSIGNLFKAANSFETTAPVIPTTVTATPTLTPTPTPTSTPNLHLVINEILANPDPITDLEWVEIYNPTGSDVDLTGWSLKDLALSGKSLSSLGIISSNDYKVYEYSSDGWLNNSGTETLQLIDQASLIVDEVTYTGTVENQSIGRDPDGSDGFGTCTTSSKGGSNNGNCP